MIINCVCDIDVAADINFPASVTAGAVPAECPDLDYIDTAFGSIVPVSECDRLTISDDLSTVIKINPNPAPIGIRFGFSSHV